MAKINIYFQDLNENAQQEVWQAVKEELEEDIKNEIEFQPDLDPQTIKSETIENHINCHNFANEFVI
ncbi:MAG: hypothetical protein ACKKMS_02505 [Candidatus Nealsonbacteria bacterium]